MKKLEKLRNTLEVGPILTFDEIQIIVDELDITQENIQNKKLQLDEMFRYVADKKMDARLNGDWETFDSYNNTISKITSTIQYVISQR